MKSIFFLLVIIPVFGISQQCYTDSTLVVTNGERGKVVSFIFTDDFKYYGNYVSDSDKHVGELKFEENKYYFNLSEKDVFFVKNSDGSVSYFSLGFELSRMISVGCSKEIIYEFSSDIQNLKK